MGLLVGVLYATSPRSGARVSPATAITVIMDGLRPTPTPPAT
jgi:hypothetical protein